MAIGWKRSRFKSASTPKSFHPGQPRHGLLRGFDYRIANSNAVRIGFATAPVVPEATEDVQKVEVPSEITGRFDEPNDEDRFRFTAQNGKAYCIEAIADRMESPVDAYLIVEKITIDESGTETLAQVADNDDMRSFFRVDGKDSIKQPVTKADFDEALSKIHTSVGVDDIAKHRKWMQEFGAT